jgi:hypothetical protein
MKEAALLLAGERFLLGFKVGMKSLIPLSVF